MIRKNNNKKLTNKKKTLKTNEQPNAREKCYKGTPFSVKKFPLTFWENLGGSLLTDFFSS